MNYIIRRIVDYTEGYWYSRSEYHNDYSISYSDPEKCVYYYLVNRKTGKRLSVYYNTRSEAKKRAITLSKRKK